MPMKISISFTADLSLENIDLPEDKAQRALVSFRQNGTLPQDLIDEIIADATADLFIEEIIEIDDVYESEEEE